MECNKDEAIRAKQIAEQKMRSGDFAGALKIAKRAQKLFPDVDNICRLLTVCEVHCAADNKLHGSVMDWYRILQTAPFADVATIKKQYKKLALLLHPDKNKFPFSESAFKLVGEANEVLSDQSKRSLYDNKCGHSKKKVSTQQRSNHPKSSANAGNPVSQCGKNGFNHSDGVSKTKSAGPIKKPAPLKLGALFLVFVFRQLGILVFGVIGASIASMSFENVTLLVMVWLA